MRGRRRNIPLPVISPTAVKAYLARDLENYDWLKEAPKEELREHVRRMGHRFLVEPWQNQLAAFVIADAVPSFIFAMEMGGGKTSIALQQVRHRKRRGELTRAIAVVPYLMHMEGWDEQIRLDAPDLQCRFLIGDRGEREALLRKPADLCVVNHAGLQVYMARMRESKKRKREYAIDPRAASEFASLFNKMFLAESQYFGNHKSLYFDMAWWLSCSAAFRYLFSGTLFGRDPTKLFSQFMLADHGETLGRTLGIFRAAFFTPKKDHWKGISWTFKRTQTPALRRIIKHRSLSYRVSELHDMPKRLPIRLPVHLSGEGAAYYRRILDGVKEVRGDYRALEAIYIRMRQCASGYLAMKADDDSRIQVRFKENPKLDRLHEFIMSKDEKALVFHEFRPSGFFIEEMLEQARVKFASLRGQMKDPGAEYRRFLSEDSCRIFVLNNKLGAENINPQHVCRRVLFYESPDDPQKRAQAEARAWRPGQEWTVFLHDLVVRGTIEEKILRFNREGRNLLKAVMTGEETFVVEEDQKKEVVR